MAAEAANSESRRQQRDRCAQPRRSEQTVLAAEAPAQALCAMFQTRGREFVVAEADMPARRRRRSGKNYSVGSQWHTMPRRVPSRKPVLEIVAMSRVNMAARCPCIRYTARHLRDSGGDMSARVIARSVGARQPCSARGICFRQAIRYRSSPPHRQPSCPTGCRRQRGAPAVKGAPMFQPNAMQRFRCSAQRAYAYGVARAAMTPFFFETPARPP